MLDVQIVDDAGTAARVAADLVEHAVLAATSVRGHASVALSGGESPLPMLAALARAHLAWDDVHVFQVDERIAPDGDPARNATAQVAALTPDPLAPAHLHLMAADGSVDPADAARRYEAALRTVCDGVLDCVHLGLGPDGHTASLFPGDLLLDEADRLVAATTGEHNGHRRITLTYPALRAARSIVWLVTGSTKAPVLARLVAGDAGIPAGRVPGERAIVICDRAAADALEQA
jgi:6-phosphogluconolactonase